MAIFKIPAVKAETGHRADASIYTAIQECLLTTGVAIGQKEKGWPSDEIFAINAARIAGPTDEQIQQLVTRLHAKRIDLVQQ